MLLIDFTLVIEFIFLHTLNSNNFSFKCNNYMNNILDISKGAESDHKFLMMLPP